MAEKQIVTTGEIARYCGVNFRTVIRWIERGHLKAFQLPGRGDNRVEVADFLDFLRQYNMPIPNDLQERSRGILIVEDDVNMARTIQRLFRKADYNTKIAHDGFRAGVLIGTFSPIVVTLDLMIPGLGGLEVLKFIRATERLRDIKILVISGMSRAELDKALQVGADDILEKPFQNEVLLQKVERLIGINTQGGGNRRKGGALR